MVKRTPHAYTLRKKTWDQVVVSKTTMAVTMAVKRVRKNLRLHRWGWSGGSCGHRICGAVWIAIKYETHKLSLSYSKIRKRAQFHCTHNMIGPLNSLETNCKKTLKHQHFGWIDPQFKNAFFTLLSFSLSFLFFFSGPHPLTKPRLKNAHYIPTNQYCKDREIILVCVCKMCVFFLSCMLYKKPVRTVWK